MNKYFVYFSLTGNGDYLAKELENFGFTPVKIELEKAIKKASFLVIMKYGGRAMFKKKEKIKPLNLEFQDDDLVIVGSPIWNDRLSTPVLTALDQLNLNKETTRFVLYPAGMTTKKSFEQIEKLGFSLKPIVIPYPTKYLEETKRLLNSLK